MITSSLKQFLKQQACDFQLLNQEESRAALTDDKTITVANQILGDTNGYLMAIFPSHYKLDYVAVDQLLGRQLSQVTNAELDSLIPRIEQSYIPPIGSLFAIPSIVDNLLFYAETIQFTTGVKDQFVSLNRRDFKALLNDSFFGNISYPSS